MFKYLSELFFGKEPPAYEQPTLRKLTRLAYRDETLNLGRTCVRVILFDRTELYIFVKGQFVQRRDEGHGYAACAWPHHVRPSEEMAKEFIHNLTYRSQFGLSDDKYPETKHFSKPKKATILHTIDHFEACRVAYVVEFQSENG